MTVNFISRLSNSRKSRVMTICGKICSNTLKLALVRCPLLGITCLALTYYFLTVFIRGLLENVGAEINPIRLIRRIKNGLEIPGLKDALIKILQDFHLQISLLGGCQTILNGDCSDLARKLQKDQTSGFFLTSGNSFFLFTQIYF